LGTEAYTSERLAVPHREVANRRFVLVPLLELDPGLVLPDGTRLADAVAVVLAAAPAGNLAPWAGVSAASADAATYCVGVRSAGCTAKDTAADAFAAARADTARDTILLGRISEAGAFADQAGRPVRVVGLGADLTRLRAGSGAAPTLRLLDPG